MGDILQALAKQPLPRHHQHQPRKSLVSQEGEVVWLRTAVATTLFAATPSEGVAIAKQHGRPARRSGRASVANRLRSLMRK